MASGGRKFNVWIAYSDLFSNLTTFLFISAFGMFAAIGSGVISNGQGAVGKLQSECLAAQKDIETALLASPGKGPQEITHLELKPGGTPPICSDYYVMGGSTKAVGSTKLTDQITEIQHRKISDQRQIVVEKEIFSRGICPQLWRVAGLDFMRTVNGYLVILGVAGAQAENTCPIDKPSNKAFLEKRYPYGPPDSKGKTPTYRLGTLLHCWQNYRSPDRERLKKLEARPGGYKNCPLFDKCFDRRSTPYEADCRSILEALTSREVGGKSCLIDDAAQHAAMLYKACRINGTENNAEVHEPEDISNFEKTWSERVQYGGVVNFPNQSQFESLPEGTILLRVVLDPQSVDKTINLGSGWTLPREALR